MLNLDLQILSFFDVVLERKMTNESYFSGVNFSESLLKNFRSGFTISWEGERGVCEEGSRLQGA